MLYSQYKVKISPQQIFYSSFEICSPKLVEVIRNKPLKLRGLALNNRILIFSRCRVEHFILREQGEPIFRGVFIVEFATPC